MLGIAGVRKDEDDARISPDCFARCRRAGFDLVLRRRRLEGRYTRHTFLYVVPPAEPGAGQIVSMILVNEETVNLRMAASAAEAALAPVQVWHRCPPGISRRDGAPPADRFG
jgi:hypothetical protein